MALINEYTAIFLRTEQKKKKGNTHYVTKETDLCYQKVNELRAQKQYEFNLLDNRKDK